MWYFWEITILKKRKIELVELEKVESKQEVEIKEPLTRLQAIARLTELDSALRKVYCADPNFQRWGWSEAGLVEESRFNLKDYIVYDRKIKTLPMRYERKFSSPRYMEVYIKTQKLLSRYALGGGLLVTVGLTGLVGFSPAMLIPLVVGAVFAGFASTRFYDGTRKNKIRWILSSIFLGKKSRQAIEKYREKLERFNFLKESYDILVNLTLQEIESDNLLSIANSESLWQNYIAFLDHGELVRVNEKNHRELLKKSSSVKSKEEVLQLTHRLIEDKFNSLKLKELDV